MAGQPVPRRPDADARRRKSDALVRHAGGLVVRAPALARQPRDRFMSTPTSLPLRFIILPAISTVSTFCGRHAGDHRADRVVDRHDVEQIGAQQDDVGLLAGRQRADLLRRGRWRARLRRWRIPAPRARSGISAGSCRRTSRFAQTSFFCSENTVRIWLKKSFGTEVSTSTLRRRPDADVDRLLDRRVAVAHQLLDIARDRDRAAGVLDQLPLGVVQRAAVDVGGVDPCSGSMALIFSSSALRPNSPTPTWMVMRAPTSRAALDLRRASLRRAARRRQVTA